MMNWKSCKRNNYVWQSRHSLNEPSYKSIYRDINNLSNDIKIKCKLFADSTSLFSAVHDIDTSANDLNHDLEKIVE